VTADSVRLAAGPPSGIVTYRSSIAHARKETN